MERSRESVWMVLVYVMVFLFIQAMAGVVVTLVAAVLNGGAASTGPSALQGIASMVLFSVATMAVFVLCRWFRPSAGYLLSRPWVVVVWSITAALGAIAPSMFCQEMMPAWPEWMQKIVDETEQQFALLMTARGGYFVVALLAPVVEEMVFRGCVLRCLLGWQPSRRWAMIALSALIFALVHLNPAQMPHAFVIGLLLGWMYSRTESIVPGVVYHWANNTAAYLLFRLYPDPSIGLTDILGGHQRSVLLAVVFSLCILLPSLVQLNQNMKKAGRRV